MKQGLFVVIAVLAGVASALAQSDALKQRSTLMFEMGEHGYGDLGKMSRGEVAYDQAKVDAAFETFGDHAPKLTGLWPAGSAGVAQDSDFHASPKVWENKADFDARLAKFQKDAAETRGKVKSPEQLKTAYELIVRQNCNGCHQQYRVRNQK